MKQLLHTLFFIVLLILTSCHSGQEKYEGQGIVGAWQLTQEEWVDGNVQTEGLDRFKIFREDGSFASWHRASNLTNVTVLNSCRTF